MTSVKQQLALLVLCMYCVSHNTEARFLQGQCGAAFVKALYQACAVARRAFQPLEPPDQNLQEAIKRGSGGKFGSSGGGGYFRRFLESQENMPYLNRETNADLSRDQVNDFPPSADQYDPLNKINSIEDNVEAYLLQLAQGDSHSQRDAGVNIKALEYISEMDQRGNTATNLLADYCCKHRCKWETFVGLCK